MSDPNLHDLAGNSSDGEYADEAFDLLGLLEGNYGYVYDDTKGNRTIGIGVM